jgi:hypothetical protein
LAKFGIEIGKFSIKYGADLPTVSKTEYQVGNSPLDYLNAQFANGSINDLFEINNNKNIIKAINECPQVSTILFRKGQQIANGITEVKTLDDKPVTTIEGKQFEKLIKNPNVFTNRAQYVAVRDMYLWSWGWIAEYKEVVPGFGIVSRRLLKPENCEIEWKKTSMFFVKSKADLIKSFVYRENGIKTTITDFENLYFYTCSNIQSNNGYLPESPLKSLTHPINSSIKNYKSRIRGISSPWGFVSQNSKDVVGNIAMSPKETAEFQRRYKAQYGTEDGQSELMFANGPFQFNAIMPPIQALQLLELLKSDSAVICDVLGYEYDLLARDLGGVALNNKNEAGKNQYQNHTIPHAKNMDEQEMESLGMINTSYKLVTNFGHLPILQADEQLKAQARRNLVLAIVMQFKNNLISYGAAMIVLESDVIINEWKDLFWKDLSDTDRAIFDNTHITPIDTQNTPQS